MSITTGLLGYWKLNEVDNDPRVDFFNLAPDLAANSDPEACVGKVGSGCAFGTFFGAGTQANLIATDEYFTFRGVSRTWVGWAYLTSAAPAAAPGIISNWANPGGGNVQYLFWHDSTALKFQVRKDDNTDVVVTSSETPPLDQWFFFAVWRDEDTGEIGIRINETFDTASGSSSARDGTTVFVVGNRNNNGATLKGGVDALAFYDHVVSQVDLDTLFNFGAGIEPPFGAENTLFLFT